MNEKYKSLVYREWKMTKRFYIVRLILVLCFALFMGGIFLYAQQESTELPEGNRLLELVSLYFVIFFIPVALAEDNGIYKSDAATGWRRFTRALPLSAYEIVVPGYILKGISILVGIVLAFVIVVVMCALSDFTYFATAIYVVFWGLNIALMRDLIVNIVILLAIHLESLKKVVINVLATLELGLVLVITYYVCQIASAQIGGIVEKEAEKMSQELENFINYTLVDMLIIPDFWGRVGILLSFMLFIAGFWTTLISYERRKV